MNGWLSVLGRGRIRLGLGTFSFAGVRSLSFEVALTLHSRPLDTPSWYSSTPGGFDVWLWLQGACKEGVAIYTTLPLVGLSFFGPVLGRLASSGVSNWKR